MHLDQNSLSQFLLRLIEKRNGIDPSVGIGNISNEVMLKRKEIDDYVRSDPALKGGDILYKKISEYSEMLERLILIKRMESGVSTLFFFMYSILTGIAGTVMEILALLTTVGSVGHVILSLSIAGGVVGVIFALYSVRRERMFILTLRDGL